jgi:Zn-dependent peptidase ImmA (M78 family)
VPFYRGFKTLAERVAADIRAELGLHGLDPVNVFDLAEWLGIPVFGLQDLSKRGGLADESLRYFAFIDCDSFSAMTVFIGEQRLIVHNEFHAPTRQKSNIAHEISHCVLEHPPTPAMSDEGCRYWDSNIEDEANWLAGALLVPREGALALLKRGWNEDRIATHFEVSPALARQRVNQTGARIHLKRLARWRGAAGGV